MRRKIAAGNWKMNTTLAEGETLASSLAKVIIPDNTEVILGVPHPYLSRVQSAIEGSSIKVAAQNCHQELSGAYTGEVSASMLASMDIDYVILGHSERREYFAESDTLLAHKLNSALAQGLKVIFCCGEPLPVREAGDHVAFVKSQLQNGLFHISKQQLEMVIIAYEPIWAIGTGVTASVDQAQEMHAAIRGLLSDTYDEETAQKMHILYGGSVKPNNAEALFAQPDVDGGLVGGASLKAEDFAAIIQA